MSADIGANPQTIPVTLSVLNNDSSFNKKISEL